MKTLFNGRGVEYGRYYSIRVVEKGLLTSFYKFPSL